MENITLKPDVPQTYLSLTLDKYGSLLKTVSQLDTSHRLQIAWLAGGVLFAYVLVVLKTFVFGLKAPEVGRRSFWEPRWLVGLRFARNSAPMVLEGYHKVCVFFFQSSWTHA